MKEWTNGGEERKREEMGRKGGMEGTGGGRERGSRTILLSSFSASPLSLL